LSASFGPASSSQGCGQKGRAAPLPYSNIARRALRAAPTTLLDPLNNGPPASPGHRKFEGVSSPKSRQIDMKPRPRPAQRHQPTYKRKTLWAIGGHRLRMFSCTSKKAFGPIAASMFPKDAITTPNQSGCKYHPHVLVVVVAQSDNHDRQLANQNTPTHTFIPMKSNAQAFRVKRVPASSPASSREKRLRPRRRNYASPVSGKHQSLECAMVLSIVTTKSSLLRVTRSGGQILN